MPIPRIPNQIILHPVGKKKRSVSEGMPWGSVEPTHLLKHPRPSGLHRQRAIMHEQDEVRPFSIPPLAHMEFGFFRVGFARVGVEVEFDCEAAGLIRIGEKGK